MTAMAPSPFLKAEEVAARLRCSLRTVHEKTRTGAIPFWKPPGGRRCLFFEHELIAWADGADLEDVALPHGGRRVKPRRA
jgi:excisionase family DNA binding protein